MIKLCVTLVLLSQVYATQTGVIQPSPLMYTRVGDNVTLQCYISMDGREFRFWYKQIIGQKPHLVGTSHKLTETTISDEYKDRFRILKSEGYNHLMISRTETSDLATYYCGTSRNNAIMFGAGTFLYVNGSEEQSNSRTVVQQPLSDPVPPGDSVALQCTIDAKTCAGEHSVFWFRNGAGESLPEIIYTHGNRSDQCEKIPEAGSPTQSCVYNLHKRNLRPSDAGTYYCAVATCGEILFGNGTDLHTEEKIITPVVLGLGGALSLCVIVIIVLIWTGNKKNICENCAADVSQRAILHDGSVAETSSVQKRGDEMLNYAALNFADKKPNKRRKKREIKQESLYSVVRYTDLE